MFTFSEDFEKSLQLLIEKKLHEAFNVIGQYKDKTPKEIDTSTYLTKKQVCQMLNISLSGLNNYLRQGKFKKHRIGSRILIKKIDIESSLQ